MAREVTLAVQSTLCRAHLPIPSSAGLLGSQELGVGAAFPLPMARVLAMQSSPVRRSEGVSVLSRVKELHQTHENPSISESSSPQGTCCGQTFVSIHIQNLLVCRVTDRSSGTLKLERPQIPT